MDWPDEIDLTEEEPSLKMPHTLEHGRSRESKTINFVEKIKRGYLKITITHWLIAANVFVFLLVRIVPDLLNILALQITYPWTFITSMFTHWEPWHIFLAVLFLYVAGQHVEYLGQRNIYLHIL